MTKYSSFLLLVTIIILSSINVYAENFTFVNRTQFTIDATIEFQMDHGGVVGGSTLFDCGGGRSTTPKLAPNGQYTCQWTGAYSGNVVGIRVIPWGANMNGQNCPSSTRYVTISSNGIECR